MTIWTSPDWDKIGVKMKVWAIPLADKGFVPISDSNPTRWFLESREDSKILSGAFQTKADADEWAKRNGFEIEEWKGKKMNKEPRLHFCQECQEMVFTRQTNTKKRLAWTTTRDGSRATESKNSGLVTRWLVSSSKSSHQFIPRLDYQDSSFPLIVKQEDWNGKQMLLRSSQPIRNMRLLLWKAIDSQESIKGLNCHSSLRQLGFSKPALLSFPIH